MNDRLLILAVGQNRRNLELLSQTLSQRGYDSLAATSLEDLDAALEGSLSISLALIDLGGFDDRIWTRCDTLHQADIPFVIISPRDLPAARVASLQGGAKVVLVKPLVPNELLEIIGNLVGR